MEHAYHAKKKCDLNLGHRAFHRYLHIQATNVICLEKFKSEPKHGRSQKHKNSANAHLLFAGGFWAASFRREGSGTILKKSELTRCYDHWSALRLSARLSLGPFSAVGAIQESRIWERIPPLPASHVSAWITTGTVPPAWHRLQDSKPSFRFWLGLMNLLMKRTTTGMPGTPHLGLS